MQTLGVMVPNSLDSGDLLPTNHTSIQHKREWELTLFNLIGSPKVNELEGRFIYKPLPRSSKTTLSSPQVQVNFLILTIQSLGKVGPKRLSKEDNHQTTHRQSNEGNQYKQGDLININFQAL